MSAGFQTYFPGKVGRHLTKAFLRKIARSRVHIFLPCNSTNLFPNRQWNEKLMVVQTILMQNALGAVQLHRTHKCNITTYKEHNQQFEIKNPKFTKAANSFLAGMQKHPIMGNRAFTFNFKFVWVLKEFSVTQMMIRVGIFGFDWKGTWNDSLGLHAYLTVAEWA